MLEAYAIDFANHIVSLNSLNWMLVIVFIIMLVIWRKTLRRSKRDASLHHRPSPAAPSASSNTTTLGGLSVSDLLDIEESLLALKELYVNKLIPSDVFVSESLSWAKKLEGR